MKLNEMLDFLRQSLAAYDHFSDEVSRIDGAVFQEANTGEFSVGGTTILAQTYLGAKRPEDVLNMLEGYISALQEQK